MRPIRSLFNREDGIALVVSLGMLLVLGIAGATTLHYTTANQRSASVSSGTHVAFSVAEAGLNDALALLSNPTNNAMNPFLFCTAPGMTPPCYRTSTYEGSTVTWGGSLDSVNAVWTITTTGTRTNPSGTPVADLKRVLTAKVPVQPAAETSLENQAWNYVFSYGTGDPSGCDMTIQSSVELRSRLLVSGNLCMRSSSKIVAGDLLVGGEVRVYDSASVGQSGQPITRADVAVGCRLGWSGSLGTLHSPCQGPPGNADRVWADTITTTPAMQTAPIINWDSWYLNANPGPYYPCQSPSGPVPTFENEAVTLSNPTTSTRNRSVPTDFDLTGNTYTCRTPMGEISYNNTTKTLTVKGNLYIDGDVYLSEDAKYDGQANLYLSGSFRNNGYKFCAVANSSPTGSCVSSGGSAWNPNNELLTIIAGGPGGQPDVNNDESIYLGSSSDTQGAFYGGPNKIRIDGSAQVAGPLISDEVLVNSSIDLNGFSTISEVIPGMPGNVSVYAQPQKPQLFAG
jgi:Tfp pilus assembly protein PilX